MAVVAVATPLVVVTGAAYSRVTGKPMGESMFSTYSVLQDTPGAPRPVRSFVPALSCRGSHPQHARRRGRVL